MSLYHNDPNTPELYVKARMAAFRAYDTYNWRPDGWLDDAIQTAATAYWFHRHHRDKNPGYAFVAARREVEHEYFRRNYNPRLPIELDADNDRFDNAWLERLKLQDDPNNPYQSHLTDDDLYNFLAGLFTSNNANIHRYVTIIRLLQRGYTNQNIADELNMTEGNVLAHRKRLKRKLRQYCTDNGIPIPKHDPGWGPNAHRAHYYARRKEITP